MYLPSVGVILQFKPYCRIQRYPKLSGDGLAASPFKGEVGNGQGKGQGLSEQMGDRRIQKMSRIRRRVLTIRQSRRKVEEKDTEEKDMLLGWA